MTKSKAPSSNLESEMMIRRIQLEDGRYLIFFSFDHDPASGKTTEQRTYSPQKED